MPQLSKLSSGIAYSASPAWRNENMSSGIIVTAGNRLAVDSL
jgi:hypothetical protein